MQRYSWPLSVTLYGVHEGINACQIVLCARDSVPACCRAMCKAAVPADQKCPDVAVAAVLLRAKEESVSWNTRVHGYGKVPLLQGFTA